MNLRLFAVAAALPLAACAASEAPAGPPPPLAGTTCNADAARGFIGQTATADLGAAVLKATGARTLRWGPPRSAMTLDYRYDRVNVIYDDVSVVTQVTCG